MIILKTAFMLSCILRGGDMHLSANYDDKVTMGKPVTTYSLSTSTSDELMIEKVEITEQLTTLSGTTRNDSKPWSTQIITAEGENYGKTKVTIGDVSEVSACVLVDTSKSF